MDKAILKDIMDKDMKIQTSYIRHRMRYIVSIISKEISF